MWCWGLPCCCRPYPPITQPLPPPLRRCSTLPVVTEVARSLRFAPALHAMADRVIAGVTQGGTLPFNGVHLRVEKDARDWASIMGGQEVSRQGVCVVVCVVGRVCVGLHAGLPP